MTQDKRRKEWIEYCKDIGIDGVFSEDGEPVKIYISAFEPRYRVFGNEKDYRIVRLIGHHGHYELNKVLGPTIKNILENFTLFIQQYLFGKIKYTFFADLYFGEIMKTEKYFPKDTNLSIIENYSLACARQQYNYYSSIFFSYGWYTTKFSEKKEEK